MSESYVKEILEKAKSRLNSGKLLEAFNVINEGLELAPANYHLLNLKGITASAIGDLPTAVKAFAEAIEVAPDNPGAYVNLGIVLMNNNRLEEALDRFKQAIEKDPENSTTRYNYALALEASGNIEEAIKEYELAVKFNPDNHGAFTNLGILYLLTGNFRKGLEYFEHRFFTGELKRKELPGRRWKGETAKDKTLYVYADQGFGDVIQFSRLLKLARKRVGKIYFECQHELYDLMKSLDGYDELFISSADFRAKSEYDFQLPLMSLPYALQLTKENIPAEVPYLQAPEDKLHYWEKFFSNYTGFNVGITWRGNPVFRKNNLRSAALENFLELKSPYVNLFSLQMPVSESEKKIMAENGVTDISGLLFSFADTAAAVKNLDLIISTDTSLPHLAGALGKPVWIMLAKIPDWRWELSGTASDWYPTMKIFRQKELGFWDEPFGKAKEELRNLVD